MQNNNIYDEIAARTGGDIYIGVVGPVRTGKSTFIKKFMELNVLGQVPDANKRARMTDELPQSGDGKTIMTTEPKFVPNEAVTLKFDKMSAAVRLIDCVGYVVEGALGQTEGDKPRLIKTPWQEEEMTFEKAAEVGTEKVICDHSTVGILVTTDGTITDIGRAKYVAAEEKAVQKLKECGKPFIVLLNSRTPESTDSVRLKESLSERYGVPVVLCDVTKLSKDELTEIMAKVLQEFPIRSVRLKLPKWMRSLSFVSDTIEKCISSLKVGYAGLSKMSDGDRLDGMLMNNDLFVSSDTKIDLSTGCIDVDCSPKKEAYYEAVSSECGKEIADDYALLSYVKKLSASYRDYEGIRIAMEGVKECGYGVVPPALDDMDVSEPELVKKGNQYGVRIRATAPSYHIVRVDVGTEISPAIGTKQQSEEVVRGMKEEYDTDKNKVWETNMFGMRLSDLVREDMNGKLTQVPDDARKKLRKTVTRIVNEGKGGVLCILL